MRTSYILFVLVLLCSQLNAQNTVADQNPNYMQSQEKYVKIKDSLLKESNTTIHNTYKAYDWYEAKMERREMRRQNRHLRRMASAYSNNYYYNDYYNNPWYNRGGFFNSFSRPFIGFRTGNWWFGF